MWVFIWLDHMYFHWNTKINIPFKKIYLPSVNIIIHATKSGNPDILVSWVKSKILQFNLFSSALFEFAAFDFLGPFLAVMKQIFHTLIKSHEDSSVYYIRLKYHFLQTLCMPVCSLKCHVFCGNLTLTGFEVLGRFLWHFLTCRNSGQWDWPPFNASRSQVWTSSQTYCSCTWQLKFYLTYLSWSVFSRQKHGTCGYKQYKQSQINKLFVRNLLYYIYNSFLLIKTKSTTKCY